MFISEAKQVFLEKLWLLWKNESVTDNIKFSRQIQDHVIMISWNFLSHCGICLCIRPWPDVLVVTTKMGPHNRNLYWFWARIYDLSKQLVDIFKYQFHSYTAALLHMLKEYDL